MFNIINSWKNVWYQNTGTTEKMPLTEKDSGEQVPYPYPVKKVRVSESVEIAYIDEGEQNADVLLLIHGMGSGIPVWRKNIPELKKHFRCIALDLPGHGYSSKGDFPYNMDFYTGVVFSFIQKLNLPPLTMVGHSLGGLITVISALKKPALINKLILVSPAGVEPYTPVEKQILINMTAAVVASGNAFTKNRFNQLVGFCNDPEGAGDLAKRMAFFKDDAAAFGKMMLRSIESMLLESANHVLNQITQPCLVLVGKEDKVSPYPYFHQESFPEILKYEVAKIPKGKLVVLSPCGHFAPYQRPRSFNKIVLEFLKEKELV